MSLLTTPNTAGGAFAPTEAGKFFFDKLRAQSVGLLSGFRIVPTNAARIAIPRLLSDATVGWTDEGSEITPTDPNADSVIATPRKLAALVYASNELFSDSTPDAQEMLGENMAKAAALKLDLGFFEGSGTAPEIRGLRNISGIQAITSATNGDQLTSLDKIADGIGMLAEENATATAIVMHPRSWRTLTKVKELTSGSNKPLLQESAGSGSQGVVRSVYGVPVWLSSQLSITETQGSATAATSMYVYEAEQVVTVIRSGVDLQVDSSAAFSSDRTAVRVTMRADLVVPNPKSVVRISGLIP
jgi:HK97 family phage major capsid protein